MQEPIYKPFIRRFTNYLTKQGNTPTTVELYTKHAERFLKYVYKKGLDPHNIKDITPLLLNDYIHAVNGNKLPRLVAQSINRYYKYQKVVFGLQVEQFEFDLPRTEKLVQYVPTSDEMERLMTAPRSIKKEFQKLRTTAIVHILRSTAIREIELRSIKLEDLDMTPGAQRIKIHGKGRKERYVPLDDRASKHLHKYLARHHTTKTDYLFYSRVNYQPMLHGTVVFIFQDLKNRAGIEPEKTITPHSFRRFQATQWADRGLALHVIRAILGHTSIATTSNYIESNSDKAGNTLRAMNNAELSKEVD